MLEWEIFTLEVKSFKCFSVFFCLRRLSRAFLTKGVGEDEGNKYGSVAPTDLFIGKCSLVHAYIYVFILTSHYFGWYQHLILSSPLNPLHGNICSKSQVFAFFCAYSEKPRKYWLSILLRKGFNLSLVHIFVSFLL